MSTAHFSVSWDTYQKSICNGLSSLQQRGEFVDMTLAADGHHVKVHQMILSLVSPYIKELMASAKSPHPIIFLNKVSYPTLQAILEYAYTGEVLVPQDRLNEFLEACKALHIKGLENTNKFKDSDSINSVPAGTKTVEPVQVENSHSTAEQTFAGACSVESLKMEDNNYETFELNDSEDDVDINYKPVSKLIKSKPHEASGILQYSASCQGSIQLVLNRYIYSYRHSRRNNERYWRCTYYERHQCKANVITKGDKIIKRSFTHNHPFHDKLILKRVNAGNMFTAMSNAEDFISKNIRKISNVTAASESEDPIGLYMSTQGASGAPTDMLDPIQEI